MYIYIYVCVCLCKAYLEYCHCQFIEHNATRLTNEKKINI